LLISVASERAEALVADLIGKHIDDAAVIGHVIDDPSEKIFVQ
jgi:hydrogenase maturation factor